MPVADTLLRLAEPPALYHARWTDQILSEVTRTLVGRFGKTPEKARYREVAMREFFPDAIVDDLFDRLAGSVSGFIPIFRKALILSTIFGPRECLVTVLPVKNENS